MAKPDSGLLGSVTSLTCSKQHKKEDTENADCRGSSPLQDQLLDLQVNNCHNVDYIGKKKNLWRLGEQKWKL